MIWITDWLVIDNTQLHLKFRGEDLYQEIKEREFEGKIFHHTLTPTLPAIHKYRRTVISSRHKLLYTYLEKPKGSKKMKPVRFQVFVFLEESTPQSHYNNAGHTGCQGFWSRGQVNCYYYATRYSGEYAAMVHSLSQQTQELLLLQRSKDLCNQGPQYFLALGTGFKVHYK